jgi:hypothetical protein
MAALLGHCPRKSISKNGLALWRFSLGSQRRDATRKLEPTKLSLEEILPNLKLMRLILEAGNNWLIRYLHTMY